MSMLGPIEAESAPAAVGLATSAEGKVNLRLEMEQSSIEQR
jgi:hypothetical protein